MDVAIAKMMGFDWQKIPQLRNKALFPFEDWGMFDPDDFKVTIDGEKRQNGLLSIPTIKIYLPPPGWKGHVERK